MTSTARRYFGSRVPKFKGAGGSTDSLFLCGIKKLSYSPFSFYRTYIDCSSQLAQEDELKRAGRQSPAVLISWRTTWTGELYQVNATVQRSAFNILCFTQRRPNLTFQPHSHKYHVSTCQSDFCVWLNSTQTGAAAT